MLKIIFWRWSVSILYLLYPNINNHTIKYVSVRLSRMKINLKK